jgi:hemolysin activation/secretion protein
MHRMGFAYQNANLLGGDEVLTLAYTTSPEVVFNVSDVKDVKVDIYSVAFRMPFYSIGDSLDIIYGNSNVNTPSTTGGGFGGLGLIGKGEIFALRWNHLFPRQGEYSSRLVFGYDYKYLNTTCDPDARGTNPSCTPYTVQPVSATYSGQWQGVGYQGGYNVGFSYNLLPTGKNYPYTDGNQVRDDRYSFVAGRPVNDDFSILRFGGNYSQLFEGWQLRAVLNGQYTGNALPFAEQIGLAGSTAVRGFSERAIAADTGHFVNLEAYTPDLANSFGISGNLYGVLFYDQAHGRNQGADGVSAFTKITIASAGVGLRYSLQKDLSFSWDAANIVNPGPVGPTAPEHSGDWRSHFKMTVSF